LPPTYLKGKRAPLEIFRIRTDQQLQIAIRRKT
jgi:hypothetical protein